MEVNMIVQIEFTPSEYRLAERYSKKHHKSLSSLLKEKFFEKIEDEYDCIVADKAMREFEKDPVTYSHEEVKKMFE